MTINASTRVSVRPRKQLNISYVETAGDKKPRQSKPSVLPTQPQARQNPEASILNVLVGFFRLMPL